MNSFSMRTSGGWDAPAWLHRARKGWESYKIKCLC